MLSRREIALKASEAARMKRLTARTGNVAGFAWRRTKPGKASMITIVPAPKSAVELAHVHTVQFLSELRVGMMSDSELEQALREKRARLQQLERMPKLIRDAAPDYQQARADVLSFQNELMKRHLSRCQSSVER